MDQNKNNSFTNANNNGVQQPQGTIEFTAVPNHGLNENARPLGDQTMTFGNTGFGSYPNNHIKQVNVSHFDQNNNQYNMNGNPYQQQGYQNNPYQQQGYQNNPYQQNPQMEQQNDDLDDRLSMLTSDLSSMSNELDDFQSNPSLNPYMQQQEQLTEVYSFSNEEPKAQVQEEVEVQQQITIDKKETEDLNIEKTILEIEQLSAQSRNEDLKKNEVVVKTGKSELLNKQKSKKTKIVIWSAIGFGALIVITLGALAILEWQGIMNLVDFL